MFCKYSDIFGKPNEKIHSVRLFGVAIIDVIFTIIAAYLLNMLIGDNFILILIILFICGIILHKLFCVKTTINNLIFN